MLCVRTEILSPKSIRVFAALALSCVWTQILYWSRMFDRLAKYWDMILQIFSDIGGFIIILFLMLCLFASALYMLQINRIINPEYDYKGQEMLIFPFEPNGSMPELWFASLVAQYKLLLGEFGEYNLFRARDDLDADEQIS